jgi:nicotinic acid phosphoribosyltransferase
MTFRHPDVASSLSMIFSENRCTIFGIRRAHYRVAALAARSARQRGRADEMIEASLYPCRGA